MGIFYSQDNGENITLTYQTPQYPPPGQMQVNYLIGDASAGTIYNYSHYNTNGLWISYDYGINWNYLESVTYPTYWAGCCEGIIFRNSGGKLFRSEDYGLNFNVITDPLNCPISEIGFSDGEFFGIDGNLGEALYLVHTLNYGSDFTTIPIDSSVAFYQIGSYFPQVIRGAFSGELYIVAWWPDPIGSIFKISHSVDTGNTFTNKYTSEPIGSHWGVTYTAGRASGSFYVIRTTFDETHICVHLFIDYSSDYGQTFTTYFHDLAAPVGISENAEDESLIKAFPNPFTQFITFNLTVPENPPLSHLQIFDINGHPIIELVVDKLTSITWDACDRYGHRVSSGIYFYRISSENYQSPLFKIMLLNSE